MDTCRLAGLLWPALLVAVTVSVLTGNDLAGLLAAGVTVTAIVVLGRVRGTSGACALPPPTGRGDPVSGDERDAAPRS